VKRSCWIRRSGLVFGAPRFVVGSPARTGASPSARDPETPREAIRRLTAIATGRSDDPEMEREQPERYPARFAR